MAEDIIVERTETDMYLVAAYVAYGGTLQRDRIDRTNRRHLKFTVSGRQKDLEAAERDFYAPDYETRDLPANILKKYKFAIQDVKSLIHSECENVS